MLLNIISRKGANTQRFKRNSVIFQPTHNAPIDEERFYDI